ncbi:MAG: hypothetical protein WCS70_03860 [Verrucomicrobiota bacterium]
MNKTLSAMLLLVLAGTMPLGPATVWLDELDIGKTMQWWGNPQRTKIRARTGHSCGQFAGH